eukprot:10796249-Prorocentrum_lima.AAC.1
MLLGPCPLPHWSSVAHVMLQLVMPGLWRNSPPRASQRPTGRAVAHRRRHGSTAVPPRGAARSRGHSAS